MIENNLLEELVVFSKVHTLAKTAEELMITQPTVTRGMQQLEDKLGVSLFDRKRNKIELNETGVFAAKQAQTVLDAQKNLENSVRNFYASQNQLTIITTMPGPTIWLHDQEIESDKKINIVDNLIKENQVESLLNNYDAQIIFTTQEIDSPEIESRYIGDEKLHVWLSNFTPQASKKSVTFKDLAEMSFLVIDEIGPWKKISEDNIPDAHFLYQQNTQTFEELINGSSFPYFTTNLTSASRNPNTDRKEIPIDDPANKIEIFAAYLKDNRRKYKKFLDDLAIKWPKA